MHEWESSDDANSRVAFFFNDYLHRHHAMHDAQWTLYKASLEGKARTIRNFDTVDAYARHCLACHSVTLTNLPHNGHDVVCDCEHFACFGCCEHIFLARHLEGTCPPLALVGMAWGAMVRILWCT